MRTSCIRKYCQQDTAGAWRQDHQDRRHCNVGLRQYQQCRAGYNFIVYEAKKSQLLSGALSEHRKAYPTVSRSARRRKLHIWLAVYLCPIPSILRAGFRTRYVWGRHRSDKEMCNSAQMPAKNFNDCFRGGTCSFELGVAAHGTWNRIEESLAYALRKHPIRRTGITCSGVYRYQDACKTRPLSPMMT